MKNREGRGSDHCRTNAVLRRSTSDELMVGEITQDTLVPRQIPVLSTARGNTYKPL